MSLFFKATDDEERLRIIHRYHYLPQHNEIYMLYCYLQATEDSHTDIHAKRISLQAIEDASKPAFQDVTPTDDEYIYALTHHLSDTAATEFHTLLDSPFRPRTSCFTPRSWDSMDHIATNSNCIKLTTWILQWFKVRLTFQEHILHCINSTIYGPIHKRKRFHKLHPYFLTSLHCHACSQQATIPRL